MKRFLFIAALLLLWVPLSSAQGVTFRFDSDGMGDQRVKVRMEGAISRLLTSINNAGYADGALNLSGVPLTDNARASLLDLWEFMPFVCDQNNVVGRCLLSVTNYMVRGIPVTVRASAGIAGDPARELSVEFTKDSISGVFFSLQKQMLRSFEQGAGRVVTDFRQREEILNFVERYRSYYDEKDLDALNKIFSDDAIIITGSEIKRKTTEGGMVTQVVYRQHDKKQYISHLDSIFHGKGRYRGTTYVKVGFDEIEVKGHPTLENIYHVTLKQRWKTPLYEDTGYVTLLWEFPEGDDPRIMVRTWQSSKIVKSKDDVFVLDDFNIDSSGLR